jgi:hypothetical protein
MRSACLVATSVLALSVFAADGIFTPYASVKPVLDASRESLPAELKNPDESKWNAWSRKKDAAIRARLEQGDLDSMVNLLLFGSSFTRQPRIQLPQMLEASRSGMLRARLDDLLSGLRNPAGNERLAFLRSLIRSKGMDPDAAGGETGVFVMQNLQRVLQEQAAFEQRIQEAKGATSQLYSNRGVSLDTGILPNFGIEQALRDLKARGLLREGEVRRIAVIGPGLDFTDKESGYDYYPQQTLQPFAVQDSLLRLGLAKSGTIQVKVFDISARVLNHVRRAREQARQGRGYVVQLPRDPSSAWVPAAVEYWQTFGDQIGAAAAPLQPPAQLERLEKRAMQIRPAAVLACDPLDLNIVLQRLERGEMPAAERFDVVIATNVFVYYDALEQALALANVSAMLKPGGFFLSNDELAALPDGSLASAGSTAVRYSEKPAVGDSIHWYRRR